MHYNYRIKEVKLLLPSGDESVFYPQIKRYKYKYSGFLWWKRQELSEYWQPIYKNTEDGLHYFYKFDINYKLVVCKSYTEAIKIIDKLEKEIQELKAKKAIKIREDSIEDGVNIEDKELIKIHEVKQPENEIK